MPVANVAMVLPLVEATTSDLVTRTVSGVLLAVFTLGILWLGGWALAFLVAAAMLLAPAAAHAESETVTHGAVTATLSWSPDSLQIVRAGTVAFNGAIGDVCPCAFSGSDDVQIADIDGGTEESARQAVFQGLRKLREELI